jgi:hypothetical protein
MPPMKTPARNRWRPVARPLPMTVFARRFTPHPSVGRGVNDWLQERQKVNVFVRVHFMGSAMRHMATVPSGFA